MSPTHAITALDAYMVQSYMGHTHHSTIQRYLHHKPPPEHAQALHAALGGELRDQDPTRGSRFHREGGGRAWTIEDAAA